jgi:RNA polymerase primary sigma factor
VGVPRKKIVASFFRPRDQTRLGYQLSGGVARTERGSQTQFAGDAGRATKVDRQLKKINRQMMAAESKVGQAKREMIEAHLRPVISIATKHANRGMHFLDLIS